MRAAAVPLLALVVGLAGCLDNLDPLTASSGAPAAEEAPALAHLAAARTLAASWDPDAWLVELHTTEGEPLHDQVDPPLWWNTASDPTWGNGRAIVWSYVFAGANVTHNYHVSIAADGEVLYAHALPTQYPMIAYAEPAVARDEPAHGSSTSSSSLPRAEPYRPPALATPTVDSDAAAAKGLEYAPFAEFATLHPRHLVEIRLVPLGDDRVGWAVSKRTATWYGAGVLVDGRSGEILERHAWPDPNPPTPPCADCPCYGCWEPGPMPEDARIEWNDVLPATLPGSYEQAVSRATFEVLSSYWMHDATIRIELDHVLNEQASVAVLDPFGNEMQRMWGSGILRLDLWPGMPEGEYTVEVRGEGTNLREVPYRGLVEINYDEPSFRNANFVNGWVSPFSTPLALEIWTEPGSTLTFELLANGNLPADAIHYVLRGPGHESEADRAADGTVETIEIPDAAGGEWRLEAWATPTTVTGVYVDLRAFADGAPYGPIPVEKACC